MLSRSQSCSASKDMGVLKLALAGVMFLAENRARGSSVVEVGARSCRFLNSEAGSFGKFGVRSTLA